MRFATLLLTVLILAVTLELIFAQGDDDTPQSISLGDTIEVTLDSGDSTVYDIELESGQSIAVDWESLGRAALTISSEIDDEPILRIFNSGTYRTTALSTGTHQIEILNQSDSSAEYTFSITDIDQDDIEIGEPYIFDEGAPPIIELYFDGEAGQFILIEPDGNRFAFEQVGENGIESTLMNMTGMAVLSSEFGVVLHEDGLYRVVVTPIDNDEPQIPEGSSIVVTTPDPLTGEIEIGQTIEAEADNTLVEYSITLEQYQAIRASVETEQGSQVHILDADDNQVGIGTGHALSAQLIAETELVAPAEGEYTIRIIDPLSGDLFNGSFTLTVTELDVMELEEGSATFSFDDDSIYLLADVEEGRQYRLTVSSEGVEMDEIELQVYEIMEMAGLRAATRDDEEIENIFEAEHGGKAVFVINRFDETTTEVSITFEEIDTE